MTDEAIKKALELHKMWLNEEELKLVLGTKVSISAKGDDGVGKIEIEFYNHDDFERITELIKK